jgi:hypothetical protein
MIEKAVTFNILADIRYLPRVPLLKIIVNNASRINRSCQTKFNRIVFPAASRWVHIPAEKFLEIDGYPQIPLSHPPSELILAAIFTPGQ